MSVVFKVVNLGYLFLIPVFFLYIFLTSRKLNFSIYKKAFLLFLRTVMILLLIFSLSGIQIKQMVDKTTTIFAVDLSDSSKDSLEEVKAFMNKSIHLKSRRDEVGVVGFGEKAAVEVNPSLEPIFTGFDSVVNVHFTDISQGIKRAATLIPEESKKRIVLISDGQENMGDALGQAKILSGQNIKVDVLPIQNTIGEEVQLTELNIPQYLNQNQKFTAQIRIDSLVNTNAVLKIYNGKNLVETQDVNIRKGQNRFAFSDQAEEGGGRIYRVEIEPNVDTITENNVAYGYTYVEDIPHVLLIEKNNSGAEIEEILKTTQVEVNKIEPHIVPIEIETLSQYDGVILANISADELDEKFLNNLENYVKHIGGGLVVTGGENAYALGNYFDTPLETVLPVEMELKDKNDIPDLGLIIVTDRSGSMTEAPYGISKLELAKEAAIRSTEVLNPFDKIGVLAFDDQSQEIVALQEVESHVEDIQNNISNISPGGGTSIIPALRKAYETLYSADTKVKHIILLTDGQAERSGYDELTSKMKEAGITLSTVAVGRSSDTNLLSRLAEDGGGRYYYTDEFSDLPKIFMKETMMAGKTYIRNNTFYPKVTRISPILEGIEEVAPLQGYIATTPKNRADVILSSDEEDPILVSWRYGLGKAVAWTSDLHNQWSLDWLSSNSGVEVTRNMISWALRKPMSDNIIVEGKVEGEQIEVSAQIQDLGLETEIEGTVVGPDLTRQSILLKPTAPGRYTGAFQGNDLGAYMLTFQMNRKGESESIHTGINIPYSSEYDINKMTSQTTLLSKIAKLTGGRILKNEKEVFSVMEDSVFGEKDVSKVFLILALLVFLFDIAFRRISFISKKIEDMMIYSTKIFKKKKEIERNTMKQQKTKFIKGENKVNHKKELKNKKPEPKKDTTSEVLLSQKRRRSKR